MTGAHQRGARSTACCCSTSRPASPRRPRCTRREAALQRGQGRPHRHARSDGDGAASARASARRPSSRSLLLDADKAYLATMRLGMTTTTGDLEGEVTERARRSTSIARRRRSGARARFGARSCRAAHVQRASSRTGKPLYQSARGRASSVPRAPRRVTITSSDCSNARRRRARARGRHAAREPTYACSRRTSGGRWAAAPASPPCGARAVGALRASARRSRLPALEALTPDERATRCSCRRMRWSRRCRALELDAEQAHGGSPADRPIERARARRAHGLVRALRPGGAFWGSRRTGWQRRPRRLLPAAGGSSRRQRAA